MKPILTLTLACTLALDLSASAQTGTDKAPETPASTAPSGAVEAPRPAMPNTLMDGTPVPMRLSETVSSAAGNTPLTLTVTPGQHTITVKKKGYTDWTRTMNVSGTAVHLNADLQETK